jgi:hypothetical protein
LTVAVVVTPVLGSVDEVVELTGLPSASSFVVVVLPSLLRCEVVVSMVFPLLSVWTSLVVPSAFAVAVVVRPVLGSVDEVVDVWGRPPASNFVVVALPSLFLCDTVVSMVFPEES